MKRSGAGLCALSLLVLACGSGAPEPETPPASPVSCPEGQAFDGQYCVASTTPPSAPSAAQPKDERAVEPDPDAESKPIPPPQQGPDPGAEPAAPPLAEKSLAAPVDVTMAAAAAPLIHYLASAHLPAGSRPFGAPFAGQFSEGQVLEQRVQLTVGKCYTVVAAGTPPVEELRVALYSVAAPGSVATTQVPLAEDTDRGPQAVLGRKNECFKPLDAQTQLVLVIQVEKGRGVAAAQVFEK